MHMPKTILCIATLDTKGPEALYIKELIETRGHKVLLLDISGFKNSPFPADITADEIAKEAGSSIEKVRKLETAGQAAEIMTSGAIKKVLRMYDARMIHGVVALGGGVGSSIASAVMRRLPLGFPKFLLSTQKIVQSGIRGYVSSKDIGIMPSVADIAGLNRFTKSALRNAAGAIVGMVEFLEDEATYEKPLVFVSMLGSTTGCGLEVKSSLEKKGFEVVVFHSIGVGGKTLEEGVADYPVKGVIELCLNEIGNELFGGMASAGPNRLEAAGASGIPQIIVPGHVRYCQFLGPETVPEKYRSRSLIYHHPQGTAVPLNADEMSAVAEAVAAKLNRSRGSVRVLIPLGGFSAWDIKGTKSYDAEAERTFIKSLKSSLNPAIPIYEIEAHVNDQKFAQKVVQEFMELMANHLPD